MIHGAGGFIGVFLMSVLSNLVNIIFSIWSFLFDFDGSNPFFIVFAVFVLMSLAISLIFYILYWRK